MDAEVFPYPVNWAEPFTVTYSALTQIESSRSGKEQRRALRHTLELARQDVGEPRVLVLLDDGCLASRLDLDPRALQAVEIPPDAP